MVAHSPLLNITELLGSSPRLVQAVGIPAADILPEAPALASNATVATLHGPCIIGDLEPGDRVLTRDSGYARVVSVRRTARPGQGELLLTDGRFADLFGAREVLVPSRRNGKPDMEATGCGFVLTLDQAGLVLADGVWVRASCLSGDMVRPVLSGRNADTALRMTGHLPLLRAVAAAR